MQLAMRKDNPKCQYYYRLHIKEDMSHAFLSKRNVKTIVRKSDETRKMQQVIDLLKEDYSLNKHINNR